MRIIWNQTRSVEGNAPSFPPESKRMLMTTDGNDGALFAYSHVACDSGPSSIQMRKIHEKWHHTQNISGMVSQHAE